MFLDKITFNVKFIPVRQSNQTKMHRDIWPWNPVLQLPLKIETKILGEYKLSFWKLYVNISFVSSYCNAER